MASPHSPSRSFLLAALVVCATVSAAGRARAQPEIVAGAAWLRGQQQTNGSWASDDRLAARDTAEAVRALLDLDPLDLVAQLGIEYLRSVAGATSVDLEARRLAGLRGRVPELVIEEELAGLAAAKMPGGGWGHDESWRVADALDTALALRALVGTRALGATDLLASIGRLTALARSDGGFAQAAGEPSDLATSAEALLALGVIGTVTNVDAARDRTAAFLMSTRNGDGGFPGYPGGVSDPTMTALVMHALLEAGVDVSGLHPSRTYLRAAQLGNGSWANDPYTTALALRVLQEERADLALDGLELSASAVEQGTPVQVSVTVRNIGLAPSADTVLALFIGDPNGGAPPVLSTALPGLAVQGTFAHTFVLQTQALSGSVPLFVVADPGGAVAEYAEINNRRFALLLVRPLGSPPDSSDNQAPIVTNFAPTTAVSGQPYLHRAEAVDPEGEEITFSLLFSTERRGPDGMTIDSATGLITWLPEGDAGQYYFTILARDPHGSTGSHGVSLEVLPPGEKRPPVFDSRPLAIARSGFLYTYAIAAHDPDGGPITLQLAEAPTSVTLDRTAGVLRWTPADTDVGEHVVRLVATDDELASTEQQWLIIIHKKETSAVDLFAMAVGSTARSSDAQTLVVGGDARVTIANQGTQASPSFALVVYEEGDGIDGFSATGDRVLGRNTAAEIAAGATVDLLVPLAGISLFRDNRLSAIVDPDNEIAESNEANNLVFGGRERKVVATTGSFQPLLKLEWKGTPDDPNTFGAIDSPAVAHLNDDNGDGRAGPGDTPDIVFFAHNQNGRRVFAINGRTGDLVFSSQTLIGNTHQTPAVGDTDGDGFPEIYFHPEMGASVPRFSVEALNPDGSIRWRAPVTSDESEIALADMDGDGESEIISGATVLNNDGSERCRGVGPRDGIGTSIADIDGDGRPDILVGTAAYRSDCSLLWTWPDSGVGSITLQAVAQVDDDPEPEIVLKVSDLIQVREHTGVLKWSKPTGAWTSQPAAGDIDNDGRAEIVIVTANGLLALEGDGSTRWSYPITDSTGPSTGATLADLDGDGRLEVAFFDEDHFYILRGSDGQLLLPAPIIKPSGTASEYPTIADADGDGRVDIIVSVNRPYLGVALRVYGDPKWAGGRPLWNQQSYHVTNIRCDQRMPAREIPSWKMFGSFLAHHEIPDRFAEEMGCVNGPSDLTASFLRVDRTQCSSQVRYIARIGNGGNRTVQPGVPVRFREALGTGNPTLVGETVTTKTLGPGEFEDVSVAVFSPQPGLHTLFVEIDPAAAVGDDPPGNNFHAYSLELCDVANRPPVMTSAPLLTATVGVAYAYAPVVSDPDFDPVTLTLTTAPTGMTLAASSGLISWTPAGVQVGSHEVTLLASDGRGGNAVQSFIVVVERGTLEVPAIPAVEELRIAVSTDAPSYTAGGTALITTSLTNEANQGRSGTLSLEILDETETIVARLTDAQTVVFIGGGSQTFMNIFDVGLASPGSYRARARYREGDSESVATTAFTVIAVSGLEATLTTDRRVYGPNDQVHITQTIRNAGPTGTLADVSSALQVLDGGDAVLFENTQAAFDLGPQVTSARAALFETHRRAPGAYRARLIVLQNGVETARREAAFTIAAGVELSGALEVIPATAAVGTEVAINGPLTNGGNTDATLEVVTSVIDPDSLMPVRQETAQVALAAGASATVAVTFDTTGLSTKTYLVMREASQEMTRLLSLSATLRLVADEPPVITIEVPPCSGADVTPAVTVADASLALLEMLLDGAPYLGAPVSTEGAHTLFVRARDTLGLESTATAHFIVDKTAPAIGVTGVMDGTAYNAPITPTVAISDANLVSSTVMLDGFLFTSGTTVGTEGDHTLVATAADCGGNTANRTLAFLIDRTAPVVTIDVPACSTGPVTPAVTVIEAHVATDERTLDGAPYGGDPVSAEGSHDLIVKVTDVATNATTASAPFIIDRTAPAVVIGGVMEGGIYDSTVTPTVTVSDPNLASDSMTLNGAPFQSGTPVSEAGAYTLAVTAVDCAGNRRMSAVSFQIRFAPGVSGELSHELASRSRVLVASECTGCPPAPVLLRQVLTGAGIPFEQANGRGAWQTKLRSGRFNLFVLYKPDPSESTTAFRELNEAIWMGDGLIVIKDYPNELPSLRESLGLDFGGKISSLSEITLLPPLQPASVTAIGSDAFLKLSGATPLGWPTGQSSRTIAAGYGVGLGKSLTLAWDVESSQSAALYLFALSTVAPAQGTPALPGGLVDVRAIVRNTGTTTTSYMVQHVLDPALSTTEPLSRALTVAPGAIGAFFLPLWLPQASGAFPITGTLEVDGMVLDSDSFILSVPRSQAAIHGDIVAALQALSLRGSEKAKRNKVIRYLEQAEESHHADEAIDFVLSAIDNARAITSFDVTQIRIDLARLLRTYQIEWQP